MNSSENVSGQSVSGVFPIIQEPRRFLETFNYAPFDYALSWDAFNLGFENHASANAPMYPLGATDHTLHLDPANEHGLQLFAPELGLTTEDNLPGYGSEIWETIGTSPFGAMELADHLDSIVHDGLELFVPELGLTTEDDLPDYGLELWKTIGTSPFGAMELAEHLDSTADDGLLSCDCGASEVIDIPGGQSTFSDGLDFTEFLDTVSENDLGPDGSGTSETTGTPGRLPPFGPSVQHQNGIIPTAPELQRPNPSRESNVGNQRPDTDFRPSFARASAPSPPAGPSGNGFGDGVSPNVDDRVSATGDDLGVAGEAGPNQGLSSTSDGLPIDIRTTARRRLGRSMQPCRTSARPRNNNRRREPGSGMRRAKQRQQRKDHDPRILVEEFIIVLEDGTKGYRWNRYDTKWCDADGEEAEIDALIAFLRSDPQLVQIRGRPGWAYEVVFGWNEVSARFEGRAAGDFDVYKYDISSMEQYLVEQTGRRRGGL